MTIIERWKVHELQTLILCRFKNQNLFLKILDLGQKLQKKQMINQKKINRVMKKMILKK
jgi:hypothetical protein